MFTLSRPGEDAIRGFLERQKGETFSYAGAGATGGSAPDGYTADSYRVRLGNGAGCYARAKAAIRQWRMFEMPWAHLCRLDEPLEPGTNVAGLFRHFGFWSLNACRIVYVIEEREPLERFGFAYGTLRSHAERGEERFQVELLPGDQSVWYDVRAFSRPRSLIYSAYPLARMLQKRFARDSSLAMIRAAAD